MKYRTLLCVVAHPDDETFGAGGALVHAASRGARIVTVCATRGEAGEMLERSGATPETLPAIRESEYRRAGQIMGVSESILLDYRDSGMPGSPDNDDLTAFIRQPVERVVSDLLDVMERVRPDVVLASDSDGGYGHPDHVFASRCALMAFDRARAAENETGWAPRKLYHYTFSVNQMAQFFAAIAEREPGSDLARLDASKFGTPDEEITIRLHIPEHEEALRRAHAAHRSQLSPLERVSEKQGEEFLHTVSLVRVWPQPVVPGDEQDMFDGL